MGLVRSVDLAELRAFCAAVDLGSLGSAARLLRVSQPALSKRMRALEALAGAQLLVRSPRGIATTEAGERLYVEARKLLAQADAVEELMAGLSTEDAPVRLAVSHTIAEFVLPRPPRRVRAAARAPPVGRARHRELRGRARPRERRTGGIRHSRGQRTGAPLPGLEQVHFCDDEVVVAVPDGPSVGRLSTRSSPSSWSPSRSSCATRRANTRQTVDEALAARGLKLGPPLAEVGSTSAAKATALSERAPVLLSGIAVGRDDEGFAVKRVRGLDLTRQFVLLLGSQESLSPAARALVDHLLRKLITSG